jgi:hypothetical protein
MGKKIKPNYRRRVLRLPDLDHHKSAGASGTHRSIQQSWHSRNSHRQAHAVGISTTAHCGCATGTLGEVESGQEEVETKMRQGQGFDPVCS